MAFNYNQVDIVSSLVKYLELYSLTMAIALALASLLNKDHTLTEASFKIALLVGYLNIVKNVVLNNQVNASKMITALTLSTLIFYTTHLLKDLWLSIAMLTIYTMLVAITFNNVKPLFIRETTFIIPILTTFIHSFGADPIHIVIIIVTTATAVATINKFSALIKGVTAIFSKFSYVESRFIKFEEELDKDIEKMANSFLKKIVLIMYKLISFSNIFDKVLNKAVKSFEKILYIAIKTEMGLETKLHRLSNLLSIFEYIVEHSFLTMFIVITALLAITIAFYIIL